MNTLLRVALAIMALSANLSAVEEAYPRTSPGDLELKTLPAARWMRTESSTDYFAADNGLFMKLFRYIDSNKIPMTAPVEAGIKPGTMVFYMDEASAKRADLAETPAVKLSSVPERRVAAIGIRGSYSRENYEEALTELKAWLAKRTDVKAAVSPMRSTGTARSCPSSSSSRKCTSPSRRRSDQAQARWRQASPSAISRASSGPRKMRPE